MCAFCNFTFSRCLLQPLLFWQGKTSSCTIRSCFLDYQREISSIRHVIPIQTEWLNGLLSAAAGRQGCVCPAAYFRLKVNKTLSVFINKTWRFFPSPFFFELKNELWMNRQTPFFFRKASSTGQHSSVIWQQLFLFCCNIFLKYKSAPTPWATSDNPQLLNSTHLFIIPS